MKTYYMFFLCIGLISTIFSQQQLPVVNVYVNTANKSQVNQENNIQQQADHTSAPTNNTSTYVKVNDLKESLQQKMCDFYQKQSINYKDTATKIFSWAQENKIKTSIIGIVFIYSYICYQIYQANLVIDDINSWSNWNYNMSLEDFFGCSKNKLEADLLFTIQARYVHPTNPTDFIYPLVQTSKSLENELQTVLEQITRYQWIDNCACMTLFFIDENEQKKLKEKQRKLLFIKHLFASWCASYKIDKNS